MRKKIFIGRYKKQAIYYDIKEKQVYEAPKSPRLTSYHPYKAGKFYGTCGALFLMGISKVLRRNHIYIFGTSSLSIWTYIAIIVECVITVGWLLYRMEDKYYKNIVQCTPSSKEKFEIAIKSNPMYKVWLINGIASKKAYFIGFCKMGAIFILSILAILYIGLSMIFHKSPIVNNTVFVVSPLLAFFPAAFISGIFQNNPLRWVKVVRDYQQGKIKFKEKEE